MMQKHSKSKLLAVAETIVHDARYAVRALSRNPGFSITSIAVLSIAIGANTAMFSVLNAVLLRPLPYASADRLVMLWSEIPSQQLREGRLAYRDVELLRRATEAFEDIAVFDPVSATSTSDGEAERVSVARVSPNLFHLLGVQPLEGRAFSADETERRERLALISHRFWQTRFRGSHDAIGAALELDGIRSRIIGVLPPDFRLDDADVWEPMTLFPDWEARRVEPGRASWLVIGRLRPTVTIEQARAQTSAVAGRLVDQSPVGAGTRNIAVIPLSQQVNGPGTRAALWMLTFAVLFVLLIAGVNIAGLTLARSIGRDREIAVRGALGASRARVIGQLVIESVILAAAAGLLGLLIAIGGTALVQSLEPGDLARLDEASLDLRVFGWASALCVLTGLLTGVVPALTVSRKTLGASSLTGRGVAGAVAASATRRALVVTQFALAMILLVGTGLLLRSLWSAQSVELGFSPERVLSIQLAAAPDKTNDERAAFHDRVVEQIESLPGVERAGVVGDFFIGGAPERVMTTESDTRGEPQLLRLRSDEISPSIFDVLETPLLEGRLFSVDDRHDAPRVAIVNREMARRLWPGRSALNQRFKFGPADSAAAWFTVVGVVADMRRQGLENDPIPQMFEPLAQNPSRLETVLVRASVDDPLTLVSPIRAAVRRIDPNAPLYDATTLENDLSAFLAPRRFQIALLLGFSAAALLMAAIGIFGLIRYSIATRAHEIGIRLAVGAAGRQILRMIMLDGLKLSLAGLVIGLAGGLLLGRIGSTLLYGITPSDPFTFLAVSLLLTSVATAACYLSARRAKWLDPVAALRRE